MTVRKQYLSDKEKKCASGKSKKKLKKKEKTKVKRKKESGEGKRKESKSEESTITYTDNELIPIDELDYKVRQFIIGQDAQVRQIISAIYRSKMFSSIKANVLIIGKSGTGKTATVSKIAEMLGIPYTIEDATKYTLE